MMRAIPNYRAISDEEEWEEIAQRSEELLGELLDLIDTQNELLREVAHNRELLSRKWNGLTQDDQQKFIDAVRGTPAAQDLGW